MKINKAYKFRLEPNVEQQIILNNLVGSARFVWNQMLAISFEMFAKNEFINATNLVNKIMDLKNNPDFDFLRTHANAVSLQQKIRDLASAWSRFFDPKVHARLKENKKKLRKPKFFKLSDGTEIQLRQLMPRFKRKSDGCDSIRLVQFDKNCRVEGNRVKLPNGVGFVKYRAFSALHTYANKATGALIFAFPLLYAALGLTASGVILCAAALFSSIEELIITVSSPTLNRNCSGLYQMRSHREAKP